LTLYSHVYMHTDFWMHNAKNEWLIDYLHPAQEYFTYVETSPLPVLIFSPLRIRYQFRCTRCAFRRFLFSDAQAETFGNPKGSDCKDPYQTKRNQTELSCVKRSPIRRRIQLCTCMREIILRFELNLYNLTFFLTVKSYPYFQASNEVLSGKYRSTLL
jgi:hypothetical protein